MTLRNVQKILLHEPLRNKLRSLTFRTQSSHVPDSPGRNFYDLINLYTLQTKVILSQTLPLQRNGPSNGGGQPPAGRTGTVEKTGSPSPHWVEAAPRVTCRSHGFGGSQDCEMGAYVKSDDMGDHSQAMPMPLSLLQSFPNGW